MTSYELLEFVDRIIGLGNQPELAQLLSDASDDHAAIVIKMDEALAETDANKTSSLIATLKSIIEGPYAANLRRPSSRLIYAQLEKVLNDLRSLKGFQGNTTIKLDKLIGRAMRLIEAYEAFMQQATRLTTFELILKGSDLATSLFDYSSFAELITEFLTPRPTDAPQEGYQDLSLLMQGKPNLEEVVTKIKAVSALYAELAALHGVSQAEYPLYITKLEVGSLWISVFGKSEIIATLARIIQAGAEYLYRRFTTEGKIASIPRQVQSVEAVLNLAASLEEKGINTDAIKDNLQKSTVIISARLNELLRSVPAIKINGQTVSVGETGIQKYLSESKTRLLGDGDGE